VSRDKFDRLRRLRSIFEAIQRWSPDRDLAARRISAIDPFAQLVVVGEAVGPRTLRVSGVPYFDSQGSIGRTGKYLDEILKPLGYTVYPPRDIRVKLGKISCSQGLGRKTAYCTDLCPTFPGYRRAPDGRLMIRPPSRDLVRSAIEQGFLHAELEVVDPKAILLLGRNAYMYFYRYLLGVRRFPKLAAIVEGKGEIEFPRYRDAVVFPCFHPSPASPRFLRWFAEFGPCLLDIPLFQRLGECLKD